MSSAKCACQFLSDAWVSAIEEMPDLILLVPSTDLHHQVGAENAFHLRMSLQTPDPNRGHSIRSYKKSTTQNLVEFRIALCLHDAVHTRDTDISLSARMNGILNGAHRPVEIDCVHADAKHIGA